jgi:glycosyltransferase involved in cell wall biosynthesis
MGQTVGTVGETEGLLVAELDLAVVVPVRDEEARVPLCLASLAAQTGARLAVFVSDNASTDATAEVVEKSKGDLELTLRTVGPLGAADQFVSSMRWAMDSSDAEAFAILAGDDTWEPGFAAAALQLLRDRPDVDIIFPLCVWEGDGPDRRLRPAGFMHRSPIVRRTAALFLSDRRELSNLLYGVFRRAAFADLADAWEQAGDRYGADYASAWSVVGSHRVAACEAAVCRRWVREGADLLERIGFSRAAATGPVAMVTTYVRLNLAVNRALAQAIRRVSERPGRPRTLVVQVVRAPQWVWGAIGQVRGVLPSRARSG